MTTASAQPSIWASRPRPSSSTLPVTGTLDITLHHGVQAQPAALASLGAARSSEFLPASPIKGSVKGVDIVLSERASGRPVAFATLLDATGSDFQERTRLPVSALGTTGFLTRIHMAPDAPAGAMPVLVYAAAREARLRGHHAIAAFLVDDETPLARTYGFAPLNHVPRLDVAGTGAFRAKAQRLDIVLHRAFEDAVKAGQQPVAHYLVKEIVDSLSYYLDRVQTARFFQAVEQGTLTREQYVYALTQFHQFVRFTTGLLGHGVAYSRDSGLRAHFIHHLSEEVDHEVMIEEDLTHLGEDVEYVQRYAISNGPTRTFMSAEESAIAYYQDALLLLSAPLAAEGVSGNLTPYFMERLNALVASWGVKDPAKATRFLGAHIELDAGDDKDGHFQTTVDMLARQIQTEQQLRRFLSLLRVAMEATFQQWNSYVGDTELWGARPQ